MSYSVYVRRLDELDALEALAWYELQRSGLGMYFNDAFGQALIQLEPDPLSYQKIYGPVRRLVLRRFPYLLWFVVEGEDVVVIACTLGKRARSFISSVLG